MRQARLDQLAALLPGKRPPFIPGLAPAQWKLSELSGRIGELCGTATLTAATRLVLDAQRQGEPVVWLTTRDRHFFPPDVAEHSVDLDALAVVRLPEVDGMGRAADQLARSGAFGLLVMDMGAKGRLPDAQLTRLLGLAQRHGMAILCLSDKPAHAPSLGALVSLRAEVVWKRQGAGFAWELRAIKDKRRSPGWRYEEVCCGPNGLR